MFIAGWRTKTSLKLLFLLKLRISTFSGFLNLGICNIEDAAVANITVYVIRHC